MSSAGLLSILPPLLAFALSNLGAAVADRLLLARLGLSRTCNSASGAAGPLAWTLPTTDGRMRVTHDLACSPRHAQGHGVTWSPWSGCVYGRARACAHTRATLDRGGSRRRHWPRCPYAVGILGQHQSARAWGPTGPISFEHHAGTAHLPAMLGVCCQQKCRATLPLVSGCGTATRWCAPWYLKYTCDGVWTTRLQRDYERQQGSSCCNVVSRAADPEFSATSRLA